jgi:sphingomyelin phosphodiesterase acid-like 3
MSKVWQWLFLLISTGVFAISGCSGDNTVPQNPTVSYDQVVTVSDLHFNPFYDPSLFPALAAAPPSQWATIFQGSKVKAPTAGGTDTNYPLLVLTLASMQKNMGSSPVVLLTGDVLGHYIPNYFCAAYYSPNPAPSTCATNPGPTVGPLMQQFINNTFTFVATQIRASVGNAPVIYAPGNIDTYGPGLGPDNTFLTSNAGTVYSQFLNGSVDQQTFLNTFTLDGYYSAQPLGSKLLIIALNTNSFVGIAPSFTAAPAEITWLSSQLAAAQSAGEKVWILMHVPPGANAQTIAQVAAIPSDVDENTVSMMWDSNTQASFFSTLGKYPGLVTLMLAGHTHMDEFRILPTGDVLEQLPGISPCFGNNPAYKVLTITQDTFTPTDYQSFDYNLATMPTQFNLLYQFSMTYGAQGTLGSSLQQLYPQLNSTETERDTYTLLYGSGSTSVNPVTYIPWNPINDVNWPIFGCTIGNADESHYLSCVTSY